VQLISTKNELKIYFNEERDNEKNNLNNVWFGIASFFICASYSSRRERRNGTGCSLLVEKQVTV
jgi:hypothetical protein